jgi:hypothetical protein
MDWMAFSIYLGMIGLVCGVGFWEKLIGFARGNRSDDSN